MQNLANWMIGAFLVAAGAMSLGYGGGMMWRAWWAQTEYNQQRTADMARLNSVVDAAEKRLDRSGADR